MQIVIRNEKDRERAHSLVAAAMASPEHPIMMKLNPYSPKRTLDQNSYLHAVPLHMLADLTGHTVEDMKDYLLGEAFGWTEFEVMGRHSQRPVKRSSELTRKEFSWWLEWIEAWAAETLGLIIPRPNEELS